MTQKRTPTMVIIGGEKDGTTTCCGAYTTVFTDDGSEYCKACNHDVEGYEWDRTKDAAVVTMADFR